MYQKPYNDFVDKNQTFANNIPPQQKKTMYKFRRIWLILPLILAVGYLLFQFVPMMPFGKIPLLINGLPIGIYTKIGILFVLFVLIVMAVAFLA